jgi:integrase
LKLYLEHFDFKSETELLKNRDPKLHEGLMIRYIKTLVGGGMKHDTLDNRLAPIFHLYEINDVILNKKKIRTFNVGNRAMREDEAYTHDQIRKILAKCDIRSKVIILLMASTGIRIGAIPEIKLKHLKEIPEHGIYRLTVYADSGPHKYYTFCSFECAEAIRAYKKHREQFFEQLDGESPLIREQFNVRDKFKTKYSTPKPIGLEGLETLLNRIIRQADIDSVNVKRAHGLRKFYNSQWIENDGNPDIREYLIGHRASRHLGVFYDRTREDRRLQEFLKIMDSLTFNEELSLKTKIKDLEVQHSEEFLKLKKEMDELKRLLEA